MIVVDASLVLAAVAVDDRRGEAARAVLGSDPDAHAPHLLDVEVLSGLRRLAAADAISDRRAAQARQDLVDLAAARYDHAFLIERMWALRHNATTYDAAYIALAELLECDLVTADAKLERLPDIHCLVRTI